MPTTMCSVPAVRVFATDENPSDAQLLTLETRLHDNDRARFAATQLRSRRVELAVGRALLRLALRGLPQRDWPLVATRRGKPVLDNSLGTPFASFSISHSKGSVCVAVSATGDVGCDVERIRRRPKRTFTHLANRTREHPLFSRHERNWILEVDPTLQLTRLYCLWTIKEAIAKALGQGIGSYLREYETELGGLMPLTGSPMRVLARRGDRLATAHVWSMQDGLVAAVTGEAVPQVHLVSMGALLADGAQ